MTMQLKCKRCRHLWNYRGRKIPTGEYPLYVTCPRCRTVVKLPAKMLRDTPSSERSLPSGSPQDQKPTIPPWEDRR